MKDDLPSLKEIETKIDTLTCKVHRCQDQKIAEKAKAIGSIEWVIIESGLMELEKNSRIRDELLKKVQALREVTLEQ